MTSDAPAVSAKPGPPQAPESGADAVHDVADNVLVLSPGVTLTLGHDALLLSGKSRATEMTWPLMLVSIAADHLQASLQPNVVVHASAFRLQVRAPQGPSDRFCPTNPNLASKGSIPYYNILWVETTDDRRWLTIDYADQESTDYLVVRNAKFAIPELAVEQTPAGVGDQVVPWVERLLERSYGGAARRKRAWVLVNPRAGPGGADRIWETQTRPIFEAARMPLTVVKTTYSGEAVDLARELNIDDYDIAIPCSGDGLPHEVFNGLAKRPDARRALSKIAVCHIPCGSGNAMSCNLYGTHRPSLAALAIVKGIPTPLDLVSITHGNRRTVSFLSQALGMIAELDLGTEHLRWMGATRFTYGFMKLVLQKRTYPCDIAVKVEIDHKDDVKVHYRQQLVQAGSESSGSRDQSRDRNDQHPNPGDKQSRVLSPAPNSTDGDNGLGLPPLKYGTVLDKLPDGWETVPHDKLGSFYCGNVGPSL